MIRIRGIARIGAKTKHLVTRLQPGEIAVINHCDLDTPCAEALVQRRVAAVINAAPSVSGRYPTLGAQTLLQAGIYLLDNAGAEVMDRVADGKPVEILDERVMSNGDVLAVGEPMTMPLLRAKLDQARGSLNTQLQQFVQNTLSYVLAEQSMLFDVAAMPELKTQFSGRQVVVVVRGEGCDQDLRAIRSYIRDAHPVLVGVDGGADVLLRAGYRPALIFGDMDSVTDEALRCGAELVVHAYSDSRAPGMGRLRTLGLSDHARVFPSRGTSEDAMLLLAHEKGAELIIAVGTHTGLIEFLDKAREGMSSTFLVRLKVGPALVDAKGLSKLYPGGLPWRYLVYLFSAAVLSALMIWLASPGVRAVLRLWALTLRLWLNL